MRGIRPNFASALATVAAMTFWPHWAVWADEPTFAVIRPGPVLVAQRVVAEDERESPRSMSDRGWSTRTSRFTGNGDVAGRVSAPSKSARLKPSAVAPTKRAMTAQSGDYPRRKPTAFDSSAAPLRRDLPKVLRDPPKTRRRPLGW